MSSFTVFITFFFFRQSVLILFKGMGFTGLIEETEDGLAPMEPSSAFGCIDRGFTLIVRHSSV